MTDPVKPESDEISDEQLEDQLTSMFSGREDRILYLKADNQLKYGRVQEAIETARRAGAPVVAAKTETESSTKLFDLGEEN